MSDIDFITQHVLTASLFTCFSTFLTSEVIPDKPPLSGWRVSLRRHLTTGPITTGRVFFESGGAQAWAAYEAVRPTAVHGQRQSSKLHSFVELEFQSLEFKARLARMVGTIVPHPTMANMIAPMAQEALNLLGRPMDAEPSIQVASASAKRRRTDEGFREASAGALLQPPPRPPPTRHCEKTLLDVRYHENTSPTAGGQAGETVQMDEYRGAHIRGLSELVPPYMAGAIKRYDINGTCRAGVTMRFPRSDLDLPCTITFDILDQKIEHLAWKLFNAHLDRDGTGWFLYYDNDARTAKLGPRSFLQSCETAVIPGLFGPLITSGNAASPLRRNDMTTDTTETVIMELQGEVGKVAFLSLTLGSIEGSQVFEKLYTQ